MNWATPTRKWPSSTIQGKLGFFVVVVETLGDTLVKELAGYKFFPVPEAHLPYYMHRWYYYYNSELVHSHFKLKRIIHHAHFY